MTSRVFLPWVSDVNRVLTMRAADITECEAFVDLLSCPVDVSSITHVAPAADGVTLLKPVGNLVQDPAVPGLLPEEARKLCFGTEVEL
jgi:hypothetical protein